MNFGLQHERAREADPLALAAAELVRVAAGGLGAEADALEHLDARARRAARRATPWIQALPDDVARRFMRGSSEPTESWKTICMSPAHRLQLGAARARAGRRRRTRSRPRSARAAAAACGRASTCRSPTRRRGRPSRPEDVEVDAVHRLQLADGPLQHPLLHGEVLLQPRAPSAGRRRSPRCEVERVVLRSRSCDRRRRRGSRRRARRASTRTPAAAPEERRVAPRCSLVEDVVAARREAAGGRPLERARDDAADRLQRFEYRIPSSGIESSSASV